MKISAYCHFANLLKLSCPRERRGASLYQGLTPATFAAVTLLFWTLLSLIGHFISPKNVMNKVFHNYLHCFVMIYIKDILITFLLLALYLQQLS